MKIRKLHLKNIGVFDDEEIEFKECPAKDKAEIHIFTGQSGSGKSTILKSLASTFDFLEKNNPSPLVNDFQKWIRFSEYSGGKFETYLKDKNKEFKINILGDSKTKLATTPPGGKLFNYGKWVNSYKRLDEMDTVGLKFAVFSFSGYRQVKSENVEAIKEPVNFNPLYQSLDFIKDYNRHDQLTINQLIANNISKSAIEKSRNEAKSKRFANVVKTVESVIYEITDWKLEFYLETEPTKLITKLDGKELDFDVLPDGLRSLISWIADLLGRVDLLKWQDDLPITEKNLILLLDEIEVHLHPAWQRKVLPIVQKLFKNAQIFVSTHSPFVVNSVDDAWVYELEVKEGKAKVREVTRSNTAFSIQTVLREVFDINKKFGDGFDNQGTQEKLTEFFDKSKHIQQNNGKSEISKEDFLNLAIDLAERSAELQSIVFVELAKISQKTGEPYEI